MYVSIYIFYPHISPFTYRREGRLHNVVCPTRTLSLREVSSCEELMHGADKLVNYAYMFHEHISSLGPLLDI